MLIGYARVSTRDQNPALQMDALAAAGCERVFVEKVSGATRDRPQLGAALDYLRHGDALVVWKLDRLARSVRQLLDTAQDLETRGIGLRVLTGQPIDTTTAGGRLIFTVFAAIAEFERELIRERSKAGLDAARAAGRVGGRRPAMDAKAIQSAKALLRDPEITVEEVARRLGVQPSTLYRHIPGGRSAVAGPTPPETK